MKKIKRFAFALFLMLGTCIYAQTGALKGRVFTNKGIAVSDAFIEVKKLEKSVYSNDKGEYLFEQIPDGIWEVELIYLNEVQKQNIEIKGGIVLQNFVINEDSEMLEDVVISGTMKEVSKLDSPVPVEVYTSKFFKANPTPSLFDALQIVNGVRPQLNCNVCNTGDIHINGLEGPYTMILIDGMPIVSGLSTVYGLSGIPQSLIDRVEIVKGPASTLYGSEAVGGLINVITKKTSNAPRFHASAYGTSWAEANVDVSSKFNVGKKAQSLLGINYYNYKNPIDKNGDGFTDMTLQNRVSVFNKWDFNRKSNKLFSLAARYVYEDRWGGEMKWTKKDRGTDNLYGESIYTKRWEMFGVYELPVAEKILFQFSANGHDQNSAYGDEFYIADQKIGFAQMIWYKTLGKHNLLTGFTYRYTYYDDNTVTTPQATNTHLPGAFIQDEITLNQNHKLLLGMRYDYNSIHGSIVTPRVNYKWNSSDNQNILRLSIGNGYRVANVFTEDHRALTGTREVIFKNDLKPETSWNANVNFVRKIFIENTLMSLDATAFYTYFTNKINADLDTDQSKVIYDNLNGKAVSKGVSLNIDVMFPFGLKIIAGGTLMDVSTTENGVTERQLLTERFTGTWNIGYTFNSIGLSIDYTGNLYGPMRLPLLGDLDSRKEFSPWFSIQNIQLTKTFGKNFELFGGIKNLLNWTPYKHEKDILSRPFDPFNKQVKFNDKNEALPTADNPEALTFDTGYVYASNQGINFFLGLRYNLF